MIYRELIPMNGQKSFYKKAHLIFIEDKIFLLSYETVVCCLYKSKIYRTWNGYSRTTMNHINSMLAVYGISPINKKIWLSLPVIKTNNF